MSDNEEMDLEGYKAKINPVTKATLTWDKELIFVGRTQEGYEIDYDAHVQWGCKPTDSLLLSLAGCMGIDTVMFLQKMKARLDKFKIDIQGERNPDPPQFYKKVDIVLFIDGDNITENKVHRAVTLSHEKYCSVFNTLRPDIEVNIKHVLNGNEGKDR